MGLFITPELFLWVYKSSCPPWELPGAAEDPTALRERKESVGQGRAGPWLGVLQGAPCPESEKGVGRS